MVLVFSLLYTKLRLLLCFGLFIYFLLYNRAFKQFLLMFVHALVEVTGFEVPFAIVKS